MFVTSQTLKYIWSIRADLRNGEVFFKTTMMKGMQDCMHAGFYILETCQGRPSVRTHTMIRSNPEMRNVAEVQCKVWPKPPGPNTMTTDTQSPSGIPPSSLLLAIREPFGKRFEHHFLHTDSLLTVIACAEARYGMRFEHGFIETMDVPRRTFTDLSLTLAQCGIVNRSVLYITQDADET
ncbi:UBX domain-containing protein 10 isoform X2 [Hypomesus transpacificus]|uniref:UBX domain-containing protein 10 isoform X2 n=1 Tax=Hypomesus transpacificus TaxID=137520 RepID=UPI001F083F73|nr:UBX domain-containing protein 10 isoform X2 [Hypomesus transpacificus]